MFDLPKAIWRRISAQNTTTPAPSPLRVEKGYATGGLVSKRPAALAPASSPVAPAFAYPGYGYVAMAITCMEAIGLMTDITSMETASLAITELVRRGIQLEPIDWALIEHCKGSKGEPIPTLAQIHAAFRERLVVLRFTAVHQASVA
ncbi:hypothetical protein [Geothrix sp. PMB-07]|uniref:hypothetical protein n=1 Tax=Geothrix sp. PMB-07 TaxID=3068640 RepID=UPI002740C2E0|nr:hypothetical protein [Geothrix sp. PMB-07]WLT32261.1 hypothetical protein Q9293_02800 [Geothrix sp. PMB-07]